MAMVQGYPMPVPAPAERVQAAWYRRADSDYRFDFWTAFGWTLLSCGLFAYYVAYQLCRRSRDHNLRRLELLDAANVLAWDRAAAAGRTEELRPRFERSAAGLAVLRQMTADFRDPGLWLLIILATSGIGMLVLYVLLDQDLVKHTAAEASVEHELAGIYAELGAALPSLPPEPPKPPHQYGLRIAALFGTCGIYSYWWLHDLMTEGNHHFDRDWAWEDAFVPAALAP